MHFDVKKYVALSSILSLLLTTPAFSAISEPDGLPQVLPQELEIELALSAAPKHLQAEATVYVLGPSGYTKVKDGSNGWTCFVNRDNQKRYPDRVGPMCLDHASGCTHR